MNKYLQIKRGLAAMVISTSVFASGIGVAFAQSTNAVIGSSVAPPVHDVTAKPGETLTKNINVRNDSSTSQSFKMVVQSMTSSNEVGGLTFAPVSSSDLSGWMKIAPSDFILAPGQSKDVVVTINVPDTAAPGGHYATVFAQSSTAQTGGARLASMVGSAFLLRVSGRVVEGADVVEFSTPQARLIPGQPIEFTVRAKNTGNTHIRPQGTIEIFNGDIKVDDLAVNAEGLTVLPGAIRRFAAASDKALPPGRYRAQLTLIYGAGQTLSVPLVSFSVVGEMSMAVIVAAVLAIFVLILAAALLVNRKPVGKK